MVVETFMDIFNDGQEAVNGRIVGFEPRVVIRKEVVFYKKRIDVIKYYFFQYFGHAAK